VRPTSFGLRFVLGAMLMNAMALKANCPTPVGPYAWSTDSWIYYQWSTGYSNNQVSYLSIPAIGIDGDINSAMNAWTSNNYQNNTTLASFLYTPGGGPFSVFAVQVLQPGVPGSDPGLPAETGMFYWNGPNIIAQATMTFYFGATSGGVQMWDMNAGNFHQAVFKQTLHEVGHTMGLFDQPTGGGSCGGQTAGQSVMNAMCNTNDSLNNMPTSVTNCDNQSCW
jgi:hypothetical protein